MATVGSVTSSSSSDGGSGGGASENGPRSQKSLDLTNVRADIEALLLDHSHDDGSYAPLFIRLSWHCSGTYDKNKGNGGSNGGTMRFKAEQADPENKGLGKALQRLEPVCAKHPYLSKADIYVLAGTVAIEATGGPRIAFAHGRRDYSEIEAQTVYGNQGGCPFGGKDGEVNPHGSRLPSADMGAVEGCPFETPMAEQEAPTIKAMRSIFGRLGFTDKETVCLIVLGHQYGK
jgi:catalase (peroxidase I)